MAVIDELERLDWLGYERVQSPAVDREVLERVHPARYVDSIERACLAGGGFLDADTVLSRGSYEAAMHSAGGAVALVEHLAGAGPGTTGFSAHRPPGHHALPTRPMGFCLFSNVAVAARHALDACGLSRVLIVDWDVHHGNGTNDVFYRTDEVLFASIHQWPLYPGTGQESEVGEGDGRGYSINLPVPQGAGDAQFVSLVRDVVIPAAREYLPELILISAGFDAHEGDPLADCRVSDSGYATMATLLRDLAAELSIPIGAVMEGGYALGPLARGVALTMDVLRGGDGGYDGLEVVAPAAPDPLALEARRRLRFYWSAFS